MSILERAGDIIAAGFGPKAAIGFLFGYLEETTPEELYEYIKNDKMLFSATTGNGWEGWRNLARKASVQDILTTQRITEEFRKHRADLLQVVFDQPNGRKWLDKQVATLRENLFQEPLEKGE